MTLEALKQAEQRTVGVKQTQKAVARQAAEVVYIANDADERVTKKLLELCEANHVPAVTTESMLEIGRALRSCLLGRDLSVLRAMIHLAAWKTRCALLLLFACLKF